MHRSGAVAGMFAIAAVYLLLTSGFNEELPPQGEQGLCLPPPALWPLPHWVDALGGIFINLCIIGLMALINKDFNVLRSNTKLQLGLFSLMVAAVPRLVVNVNSGSLLALTVCLCIYLMFRCYDNPGEVRLVFMSFLLLSLGATMQYSFVVYIPVMWLIAAQMRIFNTRTFLASLFGIVTPWIILTGLGIVGLNDIHTPHVTGIFSAFRENSAVYMLIITGFTAFLLFVAIVLNLSKTIAYNARARSYNGALTVVAVVTVISILINYNNLLAYLPLLNVAAAYQITHWFVNHDFEKQYIAVLSVCAFYIAFFVCRMYV